MPEANTVNAAVDPLIDLVQTQLEASRQLADAVFAGTEKIDRMMIAATHRVFNEQLKFTQALVMARDPKALVDLQSSFLARPDAVNYQREMFQAFAQVQSEIGKSMQQYVEQMGSRTASNAAGVQAAVQKRADGGDTPFNPVTGMLSVWESAFREVTALANRNMDAARSNLASAAGALVDTVAAATPANDGGEDRKGAGGRRK
jgi:phasin family protein